MTLSYLKNWLVGFAVFFISCKSWSQQSYQVSINFPDSYDTSRIEIYLDNGKERLFVKNSEFTDHTVTLRGVYYGTYALTEIYFNNNKGFYSTKIFFISSKPATISFFKTDDETLDSCYSVNSLDIGKAGQDKLYSYAAKEMNDLDSFILEHHQNISGDSLMKIFIAKTNDVLKKKLEFICKNGSLFYSLYLFKTDFVSNRDYDPDSLKRIFVRVFPKKFKESFDGRVISAILNGRSNTHKGHVAPDFVSSDIFGNKVSLKNYRGKYVLLNFWASWCVPCIQKFPNIEEIRKSIPENKLKIIFASHDDDSTAFASALEKYKLNYSMIYGDKTLINSYGNKNIIPQMYLIGPFGKIIYSLEDEKDYKLEVLKKLISGIK